ncbi:MAG TPA: hypothetical protein DFS52_16815 [Myxococcales bacterium]|jgi:hypothetical protein|nr:hypothetical protein [Myxococcales bacterium]
MFEFDNKFLLVGVLFFVLIVAKLLAGGRPWDRPVRRARRFGYRGSMSPLRDPEANRSHLQVVPPPDPEKEFFGEDDQS